MVNRPRACILTGVGMNYGQNIKHAFNLVEADSEIVHLNDLIEGKKSLNDFHILVFPGGASYNDDVSAGKILALKFKTGLFDELKSFLNDGKLVVGFGNGFQALVKMGLLPDIDAGQTATFSYNESGKLEEKWIHLSANSKSPCVFTKGIGMLYLPIKSSQGKFVTKDVNVLKSLEKNNLVALRYCDEKGKTANKYPDNPNGSVSSIAGICDKTGRIFGMTAQPELYVSAADNPEFTRLKKLPSEGDGMKIFRNAVNYVNSKLKRR